MPFPTVTRLIPVLEAAIGPVILTIRCSMRYASG
jgi:hypothetical protein